jgi:hypothetical protein
MSFLLANKKCTRTFGAAPSGGQGEAHENTTKSFAVCRHNGFSEPNYQFLSLAMS